MAQKRHTRDASDAPCSGTTAAKSPDPILLSRLKLEFGFGQTSGAPVDSHGTRKLNLRLQIVNPLGYKCCFVVLPTELWDIPLHVDKPLDLSLKLACGI